MVIRERWTMPDEPVNGCDKSAAVAQRSKQERGICAGEAGEKRPEIAATKEKQVKSDGRGGHWRQDHLAAGMRANESNVFSCAYLQRPLAAFAF